MREDSPMTAHRNEPGVHTAGPWRKIGSAYARTCWVLDGNGRALFEAAPELADLIIAALNAYLANEGAGGARKAAEEIAREIEVASPGTHFPNNQTALDFLTAIIERHCPAPPSPISEGPVADGEYDLDGPIENLLAEAVANLLAPSSPKELSVPFAHAVLTKWRVLATKPPAIPSPMRDEALEEAAELVEQTFWREFQCPDDIEPDLAAAIRQLKHSTAPLPNHLDDSIDIEIRRQRAAPASTAAASAEGEYEPLVKAPMNNLHIVRERDEALEKLRQSEATVQDMIRNLKVWEAADAESKKRADQSAARIAELEGALKPFAELGERIEQSATPMPGDKALYAGIGLTVGDFRRARAALAIPTKGSA